MSVSATHFKESQVRTLRWILALCQVLLSLSEVVVVHYLAEAAFTRGVGRSGMGEPELYDNPRVFSG